MFSIYWLILFILAALVVIAVVDLLRRYFNFKAQKSVKSVFLEIKPPLSSGKTPLATEQLFSIIHALLIGVNLKDKFLGRVPSLSFEIVSDNKNGIRFILRVPKKLAGNIKQQLAAYLPNVQFREVKDYLDKNYENKSFSISEYKQNRHYGYPLASQDVLSQHDPVSYITAIMAKQKPGELTAFQLVLSPSLLRETTRIRNNIYMGKDPKLGRRKRSFFVNLLIFIVKIPMKLLSLILEFFTDLTGPPYSYESRHPEVRENKKASTQTQELYQSIHEKLSQPLFMVSIRSLIGGEDMDSIRVRQTGLQAALGTLTVSGFQSLVNKRGVLLKKLRTKFWLDGFRYRLPTVYSRNSCVLSASEVASLYHFPYRSDTVTEDLSKTRSRTLPAASGLKALANSGGFDIILGQNNHHGTITPIGLTEEERERHVYIVGGTGNGKTTMLQYGIIQDIKAGKGVAVVDPHGDLAENLLRFIPKERINDLIYLNPIDIAYPIGLNVLELPADLGEDELLLEKDFVTEAVVSIFRKIFSTNDSGGHRIEHVLRSSIHTAFTVPDATLFTVYRLLTDPTYRKPIVDALDDEDLKRFWRAEFNRAGDYQKVKLISGVTAKLGRFQRSAVTRRMLEQPHSTIDFDDIIQSGKILICNLSKGNIGEDTSAVLGTAILVKLQLAALRRARLKYKERLPFYLYVDELQNFATTSFVQMLSEARKYKLYLTMAEQSTSQQEDRRLTEVILANVGTVIAFRSSSPSDEKILLPMFRPFIEAGEIASLPTFNFYARISALHSKEPVSGETLLLSNNGDSKLADKAIENSRRLYSKKYFKGPKMADEKRPAKRKSSAETPTEPLLYQQK